MVHNAGKLLSANVIAQAIGILVYPVLTRMYAPEDFGLLNLFMSIGGILLLLATADYQNAVILPKEDSCARAMVHVCIGLMSSLALLLLLSVPFSRGVAGLFETPELARWWWLMPVYVWVLAAWNVISSYYVRCQAFGRVAGYQVSQSVLNAGGKIAFGAAGWLSGGMIVSTVLAPLVALCTSIALAGRKLLGGLLHIDYATCREEAKTYRNFPCFSLPRSLVSTLGSNLPALILTPFFGLTEMGYFGMALTLSFRPILMIVQSVYQVLFQRTSQLVNDEKRIGRQLFGFAGRAALVLLPSFAILWFVLPRLTEWLLGAEWRVCGEYIRLFLPWLFMVGVTSPLGFVSDVFGKQKAAFVIEVLYLALRVGALTAGVMLQDFRLTLLMYSLSGTIVIAGQLLWYTSLIRKHDRAVKPD